MVDFKPRVEFIKEYRLTTDELDLLTTAVEFKRRKDVCEACPDMILKEQESIEIKVSGNTGRFQPGPPEKEYVCGQCGCSIERRLRFNWKKCPVGKW